MKDLEKSKKARRGGATPDAPGARTGDRLGTGLRRAARALGNDALQKRVEQGHTDKEQLLRLLSERLQSVRGVQLQELRLTGVDAQRTYWKEASDSHRTDITAPDPTRWRESARLYEEAAKRIARGEMSQGRTLMDRAMEAEATARKGLSSLIDLNEAQERRGDPLLLTGGAQTLGAEGGVPPDLLDLARKIQNVTEEVPDLPVRRRVRDPWWTEEEEEDEEAAEP